MLEKEKGKKQIFRYLTSLLNSLHWQSKLVHQSLELEFRKHDLHSDNAQCFCILQNLECFPKQMSLALQQIVVTEALILQPKHKKTH